MWRVVPMQRKTEAGFTLIELMIALVLLVILVAMAAPSFVDTLDKRRVINATQSMSAQILQARSLAVTRNRDVSLVVDPAPAGSAAWCFGLTDRAPPVALCDCEVLDPNAADACTVRVPSVANVNVLEPVLIRADEGSFPGVDLNLAVSPLVVTFEPTRGLASGNATIEFASPRGRETRVTVNRIGRISTCSPSEETLLGGINPC